MPGEVPSEKAETPVIPGEKRELLRTPTLFELQGGDERVPVIAPAVIRKILPERNIKIDGAMNIAGIVRSAAALRLSLAGRKDA